MNRPYKIENIMQYTEVVYYNADGDEVAREERNDIHTYDTLPRVPLTDEEIEDWL